MRLLITAVALFIIPAAFAQQLQTVSVSYDAVYDQKDGSMLSVACSDGAHGLYDKYSTFSSIPSFPNIGGVPAVAGYDSPACGSCWQLTFGQKSVNITAVDAGGKGFNIALAAMNTLTGGQAQKLGRINATVTRVDSASCGLSSTDEEDC